MKSKTKIVLFASAAWAAGPGLLYAELPTSPGWFAVPATKLDAVCAVKQGFPGVAGVQGCPAILNWSSGVYDSKRNRLIIWGGGHNDYYGNELYAFNLGNLTMTRLTDPGLPIATSCVGEIAGGTQPNSRHTYDGIEYMPNVDRMFVFGGSPACGPGGFTKDTWTFDFTTMKWQQMNPKGPIPRSAAGVMTAYDPNSGLVFVHDTYDLYSYSFSTDTYKRLTDGTDPNTGYHSTGTIDPKRKRFVIVGSNSGSGQVVSHDISGSGTYQQKSLSTTGGAGIIGASYPGLEYDLAQDRLVAWNGGDVVYSLNLDTNAWGASSYAGGPGAANPWSGTGTLGRWRYVAAFNLYVLMNDVRQDVYVLRLGAGAAVPLDLTAPTVPSGLKVE